MKILPKPLKRWLRLVWGYSWPVRGLIISPSYRANADDFLSRKQRDMIFILGTGRSGTQLIADLLRKAGQARVYHEPNFLEDVSTMESLRKDKARAERYWKRFRKYEVYNRWMEAPEIKVYTEVNGTIRYQVPGILSEFPFSQLYLLARDGRGVVRSVMGWSQFYGQHSKGAYALRPLPGDPYLKNWDKMSRFEKICWGWTESNEFLLNYISLDRVLLLENLVNDYNFIKIKLLNKIGLDLCEDDWREVTNKPSRNASLNYSFPHWTYWEKWQKETFREICGPTMERLGYMLE